MWRLAAFALLVPALAHADRLDTEALGHLDRGVAAYRLGDYPTARRELDAAIELVPDRANPYRWRALTELAQHDCTNAVVDIESFLSRVPAGDARAGELAAARDRCVATAQVAAPLSPPAPMPRHDPALYEQWWFWTAISAVVLTGAGVAYGVTRHDETTTLPIVHCTTAGCT